VDIELKERHKSAKRTKIRAEKKCQSVADRLASLNANLDPTMY